MGDDQLTIKLQRHEKDKLHEYIDVDEVHENRKDEVANGLQEIDGTWDGTATTSMQNWFAISFEMQSHDEDGLRAPHVGRRINRRVKEVAE